MNDDISEIWRDQATAGVEISLEEVRKRVRRSKARTRRMGIIGMTAVIGNLLLMVTDLVFFYQSPLSPWFKVGQIALWLVAGRYLGRSVIADPGRILTLNLGGPSTPCLSFYRQQLQAHRDSLRQGRGITFGAGICGLILSVLASAYPHFGRHPEALLPLGLVLMIGGFLWYALLRREYPRIQAELDELESFSGPPSSTTR
jgi:hypothetical protein